MIKRQKCYNSTRHCFNFITQSDSSACRFTFIFLSASLSAEEWKTPEKKSHFSFPKSKLWPRSSRFERRKLWLRFMLFFRLRLAFNQLLLVLCSFRSTKQESRRNKKFPSKVNKKRFFNLHKNFVWRHSKVALAKRRSERRRGGFINYVMRHLEQSNVSLQKATRTLESCLSVKEEKSFFRDEKWKIHRKNNISQWKRREKEFLLCCRARVTQWLSFTSLSQKKTNRKTFFTRRVREKLLPSEIRVNKINGIMMGTAIKIIIISLNFTSLHIPRKQ